jgi:hypothetical protein
MNISNIFFNENLIYDRHLYSTLKLPYNFNNIKIHANDTITSELLNLKLKHLFDNFLYLYKSSIIASNIIPVSATAIAGVSASRENFSWYTTVSSNEFAPLTSISGFNKTNEIYLLKNADIDQYSIVYTPGSAMYIANFNTNLSILSTVYQSNVIEPGYNVSFGNITSFTHASSFLFVLDNVLNRVIKYDASGFVTDDPIKKNRLFFINSIGNFGTFNSKSEFNNPKGITSYLNSIYVLDSGNKSVKQYDLNLNWIQTNRLYIDFLSSFPIDIKSDSFGKIYILTDNNKLFIYKDNKFQNKTIIDLQSINDGEVFKRLTFSRFDSNVFYLFSNKNVYKKFVTSPDQIVGKYLLYLFNYNSIEEITSFDTAAAYNGDRNILFSYTVSDSAGKFGNFFDNLNLFDVLAERDFDIYTFDDVNFEKGEYMQSWVINKSIAMLLLNHMRFRDQIVGKFIALRDRKNNIIFKGTRYLLPDELNELSFDNTISHYIGVNEIVACNILNRPLKILHSIQEKLLSVLSAEIQNAPDVNTIITIN